jgi:GTP cyclohydrolase IA
MYTGNESTIEDLIELIGDNPKREGLLDTPKRVLKAYQELFAGYKQDPADILQRVFKDGIDYDQMIVVKNIPFVSFCEHHLLPFTGIAHVGYLPKGCVVGLSKIPRVVDVFAKRLQVQERLTDQIADAIFDHLGPQGVGVVISASHTCMSMRGVEKHGASMVTTALRGTFMLHEHKNEFYKMVEMGIA